MSNYVGMKAITEKWALVEKLAREKGATDANLVKWRQRGFVPPRWHVPLIAASDGKLDLCDFMESGEAV